MKMKHGLALVSFFLLLITCTNPIQDAINQFTKTPEIGAFTRSVKVSLPLAYAANIAMDMVNKKPVTGVTMLRSPGDSFPCNAIVQIPVDAGHPLPVGSATVTGSMMVAGLWSDSVSAVVSVFFTNTNLSDGSFTAKNVAFIPVVRDTAQGCMIVYASEDVNMDSSIVVNTKITDSMVTVKLASIPFTLPTDSSMAVNQKAWITKVYRPAGSAVGKEVYSLFGASQYLGVSPSTTEVIQAVMLNVTVTPSLCRLNPSSGVAFIRDIKIGSGPNSSMEMGTTVLTFKNTCDGKAFISLATGNYIGKTGSTMALNLDR